MGQRKTFVERLDDARDGEEFGQVLNDMFAAFDRRDAGSEQASSGDDS